MTMNNNNVYQKLWHTFRVTYYQSIFHFRDGSVLNQLNLHRCSLTKVHFCKIVVLSWKASAGSEHSKPNLPSWERTYGLITVVFDLIRDNASFFLFGSCNLQSFWSWVKVKTSSTQSYFSFLRREVKSIVKTPTSRTDCLDLPISPSSVALDNLFYISTSPSKPVFSKCFRVTRGLVKMQVVGVLSPGFLIQWV